MRNKFSYLVMILLTSVSFTSTVYSQETINDVSISPVNFESVSPEFGVCDSYRYVSVGVGPIIFIPNVGIGYRQRHEQLGWDSSVSFSTIGYAHQLSAYIVGHYYLNKCQQDSFYLGLGLLGSGVITNHNDSAGTLSPDFVFGKELERKGDSRHFIEMHVGVPTLLLGSKHAHALYFPMMYIKYGISF